MDNKASFSAAIDLVSAASQSFCDDWWLIGSAAARISGADITAINDIDLLLSPRDFDALRDLWQDRRSSPPKPSLQFRSSAFRVYEAPMPIETFAELELRTDEGVWRRILPQTRVQYGAVFAPSPEEQIEILRLMDRPKDVERIKALQALIKAK